MTAKDIAQWAVILGVLGVPVAIVGWLAMSGHDEAAAMIEALEKRGYTVSVEPHGDADYEVKGAIDGHAFVVTGRAARNNSRIAFTRADFATDTGGDVVFVARAAPDLLRADGPLGDLALGPGVVPPRWDAAPARLAGTWDVFATQDAATRWLTPKAVTALAGVTQDGANTPTVEIRDRNVTVRRTGVARTEREVVDLLALGVAFLP